MSFHRVPSYDGLERTTSRERLAHNSSVQAANQDTGKASTAVALAAGISSVTAATLGYDVGLLGREHRGDDFFSTFKHDDGSKLVSAVPVALGFALNDSKQMYGDRGEYLRVLYYEQGAVGLLARSASSLESKPLREG